MYSAVSQNSELPPSPNGETLLNSSPLVRNRPTAARERYVILRERRRRQTLILTVCSLFVLIICLPLLKIKRQQQADHLITADEQIEGFPTRQTAATQGLWDRLNQKQRRELAAQINFISEKIESTSFRIKEPRSLAAQIVLESRRAGYDPLFTASLILAESTFRPDAQSPVGARGLMQVLPDTGQYIARLNRIHWQGPGALYEPVYNLQLGLAYLSYLNQKFDGDLHRSLVAYNWGPGNLNQALSNPRSRTIPAMTLRYSQQIRQTYQSWKQSLDSNKNRYWYMG